VEVIPGGDREDVGRRVADLIEAAAPRVLGVATGSTPERVYAELVRRGSLTEGPTLCLLDEYVGLPVDHPCRYVRTIGTQLAVPLDLTVLSPDVDTPDLVAACREYEARIAGHGGVDVQILGIGRNGHVGFNEPGTAFDSCTRVVELSETTRRDNARFFPPHEQVPARAVTQGVATILAARRIILIATGASKADALAAMLDGPVCTSVPASALRLHDDVVVVADGAALARRDRSRPRTRGAR
jgi:glucosamine-6-phosphate deaminase